MLKRYKQLITGIILGALLFGGVSIATTGLKSINVSYNNIKIAVDGKEVKTDAEPFIYEGRTFVPIRVISEALGAEVDWNDKTKTVEIGSPNYIQLSPTMALIKDEAIFGDYYYLGEVKDGQKHGHGYQYYGGGILEYSGEWRNGQREGRGISVTLEDYTYPAGTIFVGEFKNDAGNGKAIMVDPNNNGYNVILQDGEILNNSDTSSQSSNKPSNKITNRGELTQYLQDNYGSLNTIIGTTQFTFDVDENSITIFPWDYWIRVRYEYSFFDGAMLSNKYTSQEKNTLKQQLKSHQEKLAKDIISKMPDKKFYGGYYDSYYKYPNLKMDLQTTYYYSWTNYNEPDYLSKDKYSDTKPSTFRWYDLIDDKL